MPDVADITIIGAGVVGLAVASQLAGADRDVYLLEKNETFGQEQSSRNSEVIHSGIYSKKDTLKTELGLEGNRLTYEICQNNGIPHKRCGKMFVAVNDIEAEILENLYKNGLDNGIPLKMLSRNEMRQLEPNVKAMAAFLSPTSGIVDSHALMRYFLGRARDNGAQIIYRAEVTGIEKVAEGYRVRVDDPSGGTVFMTRVLINCAGLHSDRIAAMAGINIEEAGYRLHWGKGEYYNVGGGKNRLINSLIYPVPMSIGPGIHVCLDVDWRLRLGPFFYYVDEIDYRIDDSRKNIFLKSSIMQSLSLIEPSDLEPESSGIMAMLYGEGEPVSDFVIRHEYDRGLPGFINLIGIDSPGLTASPAIARYVKHLVNEIS